MKSKSTFVSSGFYATSFVQLYPPAAVSALALCSDIQSYAVGTAHGFTLINYQQNRILTAKCTLDPNALGNISTTVPTSPGESTLIRGRSLKKSLRESFRRFRKRRTIKKSTMPKIDETLHLEDITHVPVERQVESREFKPIDDQINTMVRCLYFAKTYLNSSKFKFNNVFFFEKEIFLSS
jgi:lethal(2) giant larvae protein